MTWTRRLLVVSLLALIGWAILAHTPQQSEMQELGPFPVGSGDDVVVTPRVLP